ncbi:hypothetical protein Ciccas_006134 [Cichlidogyrus casuarinus]|uniref:Proteasome activator Blm10 mid region domain-containing protein n=1 Tax=Cichlidogyrus casuarinus TaxID=1844966 RepID=A0ABD2Q6S0_9PLAT
MQISEEFQCEITENFDGLRVEHSRMQNVEERECDTSYMENLEGLRVHHSQMKNLEDLKFGASHRTDLEGLTVHHAQGQNVAERECNASYTEYLEGLRVHHKPMQNLQELAFKSSTAPKLEALKLRLKLDDEDSEINPPDPTNVSIFYPDFVKYHDLVQWLKNLQQWDSGKTSHSIDQWRMLVCFYRKPSGTKSMDRLREPLMKLNACINEVISWEYPDKDTQLTRQWTRALRTSNPKDGYCDVWVLFEEARSIICMMEKDAEYRRQLNGFELTFEQLNDATDGSVDSILNVMLVALNDFKTQQASHVLIIYTCMIFMTIFACVFVLPTVTSASLPDYKIEDDLIKWLKSLEFWRHPAIPSARWQKLRCFSVIPTPAENKEQLEEYFNELNNLIYHCCVATRTQTSKKLGDSFTDAWMQALAASKPKNSFDDVCCLFLQAKTWIETVDEGKLDKDYLNSVFPILDEAAATKKLTVVFGKMVGILKNGEELGQIEQFTKQYICMVFMIILAAVYIVPFMSQKKRNHTTDKKYETGDESLPPKSFTEHYINIPKSTHNAHVKWLRNLQRWQAIDETYKQFSGCKRWRNLICFDPNPIRVERASQLNDAFNELNGIVYQKVMEKAFVSNRDNNHHKDDALKRAWSHALENSVPNHGTNDPWVFFQTAQDLIRLIETEAKYRDKLSNKSLTWTFYELDAIGVADVKKMLRTMKIILEKIEDWQVDHVTKTFICMIFLIILATVYAVPFVYHDDLLPMLEISVKPFYAKQNQEVIK